MNAASAQLEAFPSAPTHIKSRPAFTSTKPDPVEEEAFEDRPEETSDRILFIVNNLAPSNFEAKTTEMDDWFQDSYSRCFAPYLVNQRVSSEPNNHQLHLRSLERLGSKVLGKLIHLARDIHEIECDAQLGEDEERYS